MDVAILTSRTSSTGTLAESIIKILTIVLHEPELSLQWQFPVQLESDREDNLAADVSESWDV